MSSSLSMPRGMETINPSPEISRYYNKANTPYINTTQVLSEVLSVVRYVGQTFLVVDEEWWFKGGVADENLVEKLEGGSIELVTKFTSNVIPTVDDSTIVIPSNNTWIINSVPYTNTVTNVLPFDYAYEGFSYFLTIVATKFNTFIAKVGSQSISNPDEPIIDEENELFLTTYLIYDNYIDAIVPPVSPNIYVEKESFLPLNLFSSGVVGSTELDKRNNIIFNGAITKLGNVIKNNPNHFVVGLPFMTTNRTSNAVEIEHMNTTGGSGVIPFFNTEETSYFLQPNEVAIWICEVLAGQKIHRRISSYIDRDNVIYRSGTEVGKPITGDVEIGEGISLITEEAGGTKSFLRAKNGKWQIEIEDIITNAVILFDHSKGIFSDRVFDLENDEYAYLQKGHIVQLEEDVFNLELNKVDKVAGERLINALEISNLANQSGTNTGDETTASIQEKRPLKTVNGSSLEGTGDIVVGGAVDSVNGQTGVVSLTASDVGAPSGSGNSTGTNTGDNSTNTNSNAYADSKVADAIVDGVANVAPSQNAVFDALTLKQDTLTDTNFGTFTNSTENKNIQADTDVLAYVDVTTGKWVKQTFSKLVDYLKGFFVDKTTAQTIDGVKTFTASPIVPTATTNTQAVNKGQLDLKANDNDVVKLTGNQSIAGDKTFTGSVVVPDATVDDQAINLGQFNASKSLHSILIDNNVGDVIQLTGTTVNTIVKSYTIPAGFFTSDCVFETDLTITKTGTAGNIITAFGIAQSGTTFPIHQVNAVSSSQFINIGRKYTMVKNGKIVGFGNSGAFYSDKIANGSLMNKASTFDHTIDNVFNLSIQLGNASDIALLENLTIKVYKNA